MDPELMKIVLATMGGGNQETIAEYNPYLQFAAAPQAMAQTIQANIGKSVDSNELWKNAFAASIGGLASGALQGLGQDYQGTLTDRYNSALLGTLAGQPAENSNLPEGLFGDIQRKAKLFKVQQVMSDYAKRQELNQAKELLQMKNQAALKQAVAVAEAKLGAGGIKDPLVTESLAKARLGKEITQEEADKISQQPPAIQRIFDQARYKSDVSERAEDQMGFKKRQSTVGAYRPVSKEAPVFTPQNAGKLNERIMAIENIALLTEEMAKTDSFALTGEEAISNSAYNDILKNAFRRSTNSGANFTKYEMGIVDSLIIPTLAAGRPLATIFAGLTGRKKEAIADIVIRGLRGGLDAELASMGYTRPDGLYTANQKDMIKTNYGVDIGIDTTSKSPSASPETVASPPKAPPGYKVQQNPKTGEYRVVPK